ncbi:HAD-like protein [Hypoxylon sp. FL1857]|nr:HAD-like protein [Hypoxylon sp. FL1857]
MSESGGGDGEGHQPPPQAPLNPDATVFTLLQCLQGHIPQPPATPTPDSIVPQPEADSPPASGSPYSPPPAVPAQPTTSPTPQIPNASSADAMPKTQPRRRRKWKKDTIIPPSAASGGIPEPTQEYLRYASIPPFILPHPRPILVVIDLNGTLLHRPSRHHPTSFVERPFARTFLGYCISVFKVVFWSSAKLHNVEQMCKQLLTPEQLEKVVAIWGRDRFGLTEEDYMQRVQCYKRLSTLWNDEQIAASHPDAALGKRWSQADTLLIDDSVEKARSEPYNLVRIPEFKGDEEEKGYILPQVHDYINECSRQADISTFIHSRPFKEDPNWVLVSEVSPGTVGK